MVMWKIFLRVFHCPMSVAILLVRIVSEVCNGPDQLTRPEPESSAAAIPLIRHLMFAACFMLVYCLAYSSNPEDGGDIFLRNVGLLSMDFTALYPRRQNSAEYVVLCACC
jgi:hypothetical protein